MSIWVSASFAQSIDGKIASLSNPRIRLGSSADLSRLRARRNQFDAVLVGGRTFSAWPLPYKGEFPIHNIVLTRQKLARQITDSDLWTLADVSLHILGPEDDYDPSIHHVEGFGGITGVLALCQELGVRRLLIEGGGNLLFEFLQHHPIHELFVTLCPLLLGGADSPTPLDGQAFVVPHEFTLQSVEQVQNELYLHYVHSSLSAANRISHEDPDSSF